MEFKQVIIEGYTFNVALATRHTTIVDYVTLDTTLAAKGDYIVRDRFFKLYVMTPAEAKKAFGNKLEVFK